MASIEEYRSKGRVAFAARNFKEASALYRAALDKFGPDAVFLSNLAQCHLNMGEPNQAYADASAGLACDPSQNIKIKLLFRKGAAAKSIGKASEACDCFQQVLRLDLSNKSAREELESLQTSPAKKFKASRDVDVPIEFVDLVPEEISAILNLPLQPECRQTKVERAVVDEAAVNEAAKELLGDKSQPKIEVISEPKTPAPQSSMRHLASLKGVSTEKKIGAYKFVLSIDEQTLSSLFASLGVDHEFFELFLEAANHELQQSRTGAESDGILKSLATMATFSRCSLTLSLSNPELVHNLLETVRQKAQQNYDAFRRVLLQS